MKTDSTQIGTLHKSGMSPVQTSLPHRVMTSVLTGIEDIPDICKQANQSAIFKFTVYSLNE